MSRGKIKVRLISALVKAKDVIYDVRGKSFEQNRKEIARTMMSLDGQEFHSIIVSAKSKDGTEIPVRITKLKNLPLDGNNPVFIEVYGGFGQSVYFYPEYGRIRADFLKRGGILVDPALRGGNEFGDGWHEAAILGDKIKTFQDLIATSHFLVEQNFTKPEKIIISGASNGGLTVAAAALLSPKDFGLVIPVNGVHDMLRKETLDENFYRGWAFEYGDSAFKEHYDHLSAISPLVLAAKKKELPNFLVMNGREDSRVNPAHSYKLYDTLRSNSPDKVRMTSISNSGHWVDIPDYQGVIGWRAQTVMWTYIYDYLGWQRAD